MTSKALFFAVSGQTCSGRLSLYNGLRHELPRRFPYVEFEFIGKPFSEDLQHPLLWSSVERRRFPTAKLLDRWGDLEQFNKHKGLEQLLKTGKIVVSHGFGLDAMMYAAACATCTDQNDEAFRMHDLLVKDRLSLNSITPPTYLITQADDTITVDRMLQKHPLGNIRRDVLMEFVKYEKGVMDRYSHLKGQHLEFINSSGPVNSLVERGVSFISAHIHQRDIHVA